MTVKPEDCEEFVLVPRASIEGLHARVAELSTADMTVTQLAWEHVRFKAALGRIAKLDGLPTTVGSPSGYRGIADVLSGQIAALQDIAVAALADETGVNHGD